jgi:hypothetical protein
MAGKHRSRVRQDTDVRFVITIPGALKAHLSDAALSKERSLNAEIVERLLYPYDHDEYATLHGEQTIALSLCL